MRIRIHILTVAVLVFALSEVGLAQQGELKIEVSSSLDDALPGQMIEVFVAGVSTQLGPPIPLDRFQVLVTQGGVTRQAKVRSVVLSFTNSSVTRPSSSAENVPNITEQLAGLKPHQVLTFMAPLDLHEGEAAVVVKYRERQSNEVRFKVTNRLAAPQVGMRQVAITLSLRTPPHPDDAKQIAKRGFTLERGRDTEIYVRPLMDPEVPDSGVVVTFKQGSFSSAVNAKIVRKDGTESDDPRMMFAPIRYQVTVHAPEELELGAARIEVRLMPRGQLGEPGFAEVLITDSSGSAGGVELFKPHLTNLGERRIGIGQAVRVSVDAKWLEPEPSKALIVLEQGSKRIELKPEVNSASFGGGLPEHTPALLFARVEGGDLKGKVNVRVYNPAKGARDGLSESTPIEVVEAAVPPLGIKVGEAAKLEIARLRALREEALKHDLAFPAYDPNARYVTIRAIGLDHNPNFIRVTFEQEGRQFTLKNADFSLVIDDGLVVRVPDAIKPGSVKLTIQNRGASGLSDPVISSVEITQPTKK